MKKLKIGDSVEFTFNGINIVGYVDDITTRENIREFCTYYSFSQTSDSEQKISLSLTITEEKKDE